MSQSGSYTTGGGGGGALNTLTGNTGGAVGPTGGNINVVGSGSISVTGNPGTSTLTISSSSATANSFPTDSGTATPSAGVLDVLGGLNLNTAGATNVVTINMDNVYSVSPGATNHVVFVDSTGALGSSTGTNGQVIIGATAGDPAWASITAGTGISITPAANAITIDATGLGAFIWSVITVNQAAAVNNGYICNKAGTLALALPATALIGDMIQVTGINTAAGWQITQAANQQIFFGTSSTTLGVAGTLTSTAIRDSISMVCVVAGANTVWNVISSIGSPAIA